MRIIFYLVCRIDSEVPGFSESTLFWTDSQLFDVCADLKHNFVVRSDTVHALAD